MKKFVELKVGSKAYKLRFSTNAMIEYEIVTGNKIQNMEKQFVAWEKGELDIASIRQLLHVMLVDHHEDVTLKEAGIIISDAGLQVATKAVLEAVLLAFPSAKAPGASGGKRKAVKPKSRAA